MFVSFNDVLAANLKLLSLFLTVNIQPFTKCSYWWLCIAVIIYTKGLVGKVNRKSTSEYLLKSLMFMLTVCFYGKIWTCLVAKSTTWTGQTFRKKRSKHGQLCVIQDSGLLSLCCFPLCHHVWSRAFLILIWCDFSKNKAIFRSLRQQPAVAAVLQQTTDRPVNYKLPAVITPSS